MTPWSLPAEDLDTVVERARDDLERWRGARVLLTGATGWLGSWVAAALLRAEESLLLGLRLEVLTRRPGDAPLVEGPHLRFVGGDVTSATALISGGFDLVVHGAASSSATYGRGDGEPRQMAATIVDGTRQVLEVAARNRARVLLLSSGAVYGSAAAGPVGEDATTAPDPMDPRSAYGQAKRLAETLGAAATAAGDADVVMARLFSFIGPRMPLRGHFAAGNFLRDACAGRSVRVEGDGRPVRSYLYSGELPEWCVALATRGRPGRAYNVGSPDAVSIAGLAAAVATSARPALPVLITGTPSAAPPHHYVPDVRRAGAELGLAARVGLPDAIARTARWLGTSGARTTFS